MVSSGSDTHPAMTATPTLIFSLRGNRMPSHTALSGNTLEIQLQRLPAVSAAPSTALYAAAPCFIPCSFTSVRGSCYTRVCSQAQTCPLGQRNLSVDFAVLAVACTGFSERASFSKATSSKHLSKRSLEVIN